MAQWVEVPAAKAGDIRKRKLTPSGFSYDCNKSYGMRTGTHMHIHAHSHKGHTLK